MLLRANSRKFWVAPRIFTCAYFCNYLHGDLLIDQFQDFDLYILTLTDVYMDDII